MRASIISDQDEDGSVSIHRPRRLTPEGGKAAEGDEAGSERTEREAGRWERDDQESRGMLSEREKTEYSGRRMRRQGGERTGIV